MKPAKPKQRRQPRPVGSVKVFTERRADGSTYPVRIIKYRDNGPYSAANWMGHARWVWIQHHGPVPAGKRVVHLDGDTLNDAIENLALYTAADVIGAWHMDNPQASERNYRAAGKARQKYNAESAQLRRATSFLPTFWYPVHIHTGEIRNEPMRKRWMVYGEGARMVNGRGCLSVALGWPQLDGTTALLLAAAVALGEPSIREAAKRARVIATDYGQSSPDTLQAWYPRKAILRHLGLITLRRDVVQASDLAIASRGPVIAFRAVRGATLIEQFGTPIAAAQWFARRDNPQQFTPSIEKEVA